MRSILKYNQFLNEMWDTNLDVNPIRKDNRDDEGATYEFEIDGNIYQVFILTRRSYDVDDKFQLELHFSAKKEGSNEFSSDLTGKYNMQKVMAGVWKSLIKWSREVCKGGYLVSLIIAAKSETKGDDRRARIYSDFMARKASQVGMIVTGSEDITDIWMELHNAFGGGMESVVTKYSIEKFPIERLNNL